jgi:hypothetical protein
VESILTPGTLRQRRLKDIEMAARMELKTLGALIEINDGNKVFK